MKYFLVSFLIGILCQNTLARGLDNPVLNDFERRLVRLEERQFSESENLEHRMLQLEIHLGNIKEENTLETNPYEISRVKNPAEDLIFLQRLESMDRNWVEKLEVQGRELSSKHENLSERLSAIERQFRETQRKTSLSEITKKSEELEQQEFISVKPNTEPGTGLGYGEDFGSGNGESQPEFGSGYGESEVENRHTMSETFRKIGSNYYFVEGNEEKKKTWKSAVAYCKQMNAHLVNIQDEAEWSVLSFTGLHPSRTYWIDIYDLSTEGKFVSESTGKTDPFLKWAVDEPSSSPGDADCVELSANMIFRMNVADCLAKNFYVCELNI